MKRFYCTVCKKVRRVRRLPVIIETPNATAVNNRTGVCDFHAGQSRRTSNYSAKVAR